MKEKYSSEGISVLDTMASAGKFNAWMYETVRPHMRKSIIEFGSGSGTFSKMIAKDFPKSRIVLSDFDDMFVRKLHKEFGGMPNISSRKIDLENKKDFFELEDSFDTAIALNVMEHVPDDQKAIGNIYASLQKGGRFIMLVPAYRSLYGEVDKSIGHHRRYSKSDIRQKALKAGFSIKKMHYFNAPGIVGWIVNGKIMKKKTIDPGAMAAYEKLIGVVKKIDPLFAKVAGLSIIAVLEK